MIRIEGSEDKKVCADKAIPAGMFICMFTGPVIDYNQTLKLGSKESFAFQVDMNEYIYLDEPARYFNHSCEPNCGVTPELGLIALRDIVPGEELRWDYSTSMLEHHWTMKCSCGSKTCRHMVGDFTTLPVALREEYIRTGIVQRFILESIKRKA